MIAIKQSKEIRAPIESVFDRLADLPTYRTWLNGAGMFRDCEVTSEQPIAVGTTYVDRTLFGHFRGEVIELERPHRIAFRQVLTWAGIPIFAAQQVNTLESANGATMIHHDFKGRLSIIAWIAQPIIAQIVRAERKRIMTALEASFGEAPAEG